MTQQDHPGEEQLLEVLADNNSMVNRSVIETHISRSLPHFFFQGFYETADGQIDWVAIRMQDGTELGIINGRVIDLSQGNLILVNQDK